MEFILEFLKQNKSLEFFKQLPLFSSTELCIGSEVPRIIEKIDFLEKLKSNLNGLDYMHHKKYIEVWKRGLEKNKEEVEKKEYIENAD